jgi:hypothetical protein
MHLMPGSKVISDAVNFGLLVGCVTWVSQAFCKKNGRYFVDREKTMMIIGFISIDVIFQLLVAFAQISRTSFSAKFSQESVITGLVFIIGLVLAAHAIVIWFFVNISISKKWLIKQGIIAS